MHIPDGFLDPGICLATGVVSAAGVAGALRGVRPERDPGLTPRMGMTAAYLFAAQMVNFPVAAGTSGHLLGALLAAVLLGPHAATVVMASVFLIQSFFFLDGGHTALGANVLNMGLAGTYGGYAVYRLLAGRSPDRRRSVGSAALAAWVSVMLGAALTSAELALSGAIAPERVFPAMLGVHAVIGLGEGGLTAAALGLLWSVRPDLITGRAASLGGERRWAWLTAGGLAPLALLAPLASASPDGLEWVAEGLGFAARARASRLAAPAPDYTLPGLEQASWAPLLVSLLGAALMVASLALLMRLRRSGRGVARVEAAVALDARVKLGCVLALVLTAVLLPSREAGKLLILGAFALVWAAAARPSLRWLAGRALLLLPFVGLASLAMLRMPSGEDPDLSFYALAFLRAITSLLATAALVGTTPEPELMAALSAYRLPRPMIGTTAFALRYLRVLAGEAGRMLQARAARSAGDGTLALRASVAGGLVGSLFIRSFERAERVERAMAARGFRGELPRIPVHRLSRTDLLFALGFALLLLGVWVWPAPR
jgi:cobalt/nickel transport system permease protein